MKWDADNRLIQIDYPGTNNNSQFSYDGLCRNTKIVETVSGSIASTKQFVWTPQSRKKPAESRDAVSSVENRYFGFGQQNSLTKYFYTRDHLASVREFTNQSGVIQAQYGFDPFGSMSKIVESIAPEYTYAGYYLHQRSGLYQTLFRFYQPKTSCWLSRDIIMEPPAYHYVANSPILYKDSFGLFRDYGKDAYNAGKYTWDAGTRFKNRIEEGLRDIGESGLNETWQANAEAGAAEADSRNSGLDGQRNGQQDAYRHCLWACCMASNPAIGAKKAAQILAMHESMGGGPDDENAMDACNNKAGICAAEDPNKDDDDPHKNCQKKCMKKLKDGKLCVMDN